MLKRIKWESMVFAVFLTLTIIIAVTSFFSGRYLQEYTDMLQLNVHQRLIRTAESAAEAVSVTELDEFADREDRQKPEYSVLKQKLIKFAEDNNVMFVYYMRLHDIDSPEKLEYIIDNDIDPDTEVGVGDFTEPDAVVMDAWNGEAVSNTLGTYSSGWEGILAAYAPIYDESGKVAAVAGIDISDEEMVGLRNRTNTISIFLFGEMLALIAIAYLITSVYRKKARDYYNANMAKSQFLSRMSHEIRTPMNAIIGFTRMAKESVDQQKTAEYLENINASSRFLLSLINDVLDISKIEAGKMKLKLETASLKTMMEEIRSIMDAPARAKNIALEVSAGENVPEYVKCDYTHLMQVIVNYASNAVKFTPEGGSVRVSLEVSEIKNGICSFELTVADTGIGISAEDSEKIFEPFVQADDTITRKFGGTGLGLAISKLLIQMMNGTVSLTSEVGKGSTFKIQLALEIANAPEQAAENDMIGSISGKEIAMPDCSGKFFLLVEDNEINQVIACNLFEDSVAIIEIANNGVEAVEMFSRSPEKYSVIFMDVQMPVMDGLEATRQIRSSGLNRAKQIPIIAMTANVFKEDVENVLDAGMDAHLGKPLETEAVISAIDYALNLERKSE